MDFRLFYFPSNKKKLGVFVKDEYTRYKTKKCKIFMVESDNTIHFYFDGYGLNVKCDKQYKVGDIVHIKYKGDIGTPDFIWKIGG